MNAWNIPNPFSTPRYAGPQSAANSHNILRGWNKVAPIGSDYVAVDIEEDEQFYDAPTPDDMQSGGENSNSRYGTFKTH